MTRNSLLDEQLASSLKEDKIRSLLTFASNAVTNLEFQVSLRIYLSGRFTSFLKLGPAVNVKAFEESIGLTTER